MINTINNKKYIMMDENKEKSLHKDAFNDTYSAIGEFSDQSQEIYTYIEKNSPENQQDLFIHNVLCSPPGHGKTTALNYHMKMEMVQPKKQPYLLVFNNKDTMNTFYEDVNKFANTYTLKNAILAIDEHNLEQYQDMLDYYQIICILQQRLRDLAIGFGKYSSFLWYRQEPFHFGKESPKSKSDRKFVHRTIIVDEMPIFFNSIVFDIGEENNVLKWYDAFVKNTNEDQLSAEEVKNGRSIINNLLNMELNNIGNKTLKLIRFIANTPKETELQHILDSLNKNDANYENINRYHRFMRLLGEDNVGAINHTSKKTNILTSEFIDYQPFGNILILDGTANLTHTIYDYAGFQIKPIHNYHNYLERLRFIWYKINTSSRKRIDPNSGVKEQIAENIIEQRNKGIDILPIPAKNDKDFYIKFGAITPEQHQKYFMDRQDEGDSLALNIHNLTGKNDISQYNHLALLNLPIMQPDDYRLKAIALYGTDIDLRLVKELDREEQKLHKGQWFADSRLQNLFEEQQKAELSQIIHRSNIRNINSDEEVTIHLYHNQKSGLDLLKEVFHLPDDHIKMVNLQKKNNFKSKCRIWALRVSENLKDNPNQDFTVSKAGGYKFKKWVENYWNENEQVIRDIFREYYIIIQIKGGRNYKYFTLVDGMAKELLDIGDDLEELFS